MDKQHIIFITSKERMERACMGNKIPVMERTTIFPENWPTLEAVESNKWTTWLDLDYCETPEEIDEVLTRENPDVDTKTKYEYLYCFMKVLGVSHMGGIENDYDLLYSFIRDAFLSGNWRSAN